MSIVKILSCRTGNKLKCLNCLSVSLGNASAMKKFILPVLLVAIACTNAVVALATHLYGGELLYSHIEGRSYRVVLTMYGDCAGENFGKLIDATPVVTLYDGTTTVSTFMLRPESGSGVEVSPVCPDEVNNTNCKGGVLPGVKRFIYSDTIQIPYQSANWSIVFAGTMGNNSYAGRSNSITNVATSTPMLLAAKLNNTVGDNSSPAYNTIPTPFYCINTQQQYNQGAGDPNNDSLVFSLVPVNCFRSFL